MFVFAISIVGLALAIFAMTVTGGSFVKEPGTISSQVSFLPMLGFGVLCLGAAIFSGNNIFKH